MQHSRVRFGQHLARVVPENLEVLHVDARAGMHPAAIEKETPQSVSAAHSPRPSTPASPLAYGTGQRGRSRLLDEKKKKKKEEPSGKSGQATPIAKRASSRTGRALAFTDQEGAFLGAVEQQRVSGLAGDFAMKPAATKKRGSANAHAQ